jgi:hypothetical protein
MTAPSIPVPSPQEIHKRLFPYGALRPVCLSETHTRIYWWCSPPKIGTANVRPTVWTARGIGASLFSDRCVRASL